MKSYSLEHFEFTKLPEGGIEIISVKDKSVTEAEIPEGAVSIVNGAFRGCGELVTVRIPESVRSLGNGVFVGCDALEQIIYGGDKSSWKKIRMGTDNNIFATVFVTFESEEQIKDTEYRPEDYLAPSSEGSAKTSGAQKSSRKGGEGEKTDGIKWQSVLNFVRSGKFIIPVSAALTLALLIGILFIFIPGVERPQAPADDPATLESMGFICESVGAELVLTSYCGSLSVVDIPKGITAIGAGAFSSNQLITEVNIPGGVTSIGFNAFWNCQSLSRVNIGNGVTVIGGSALSDCTSLTELTLPNSVVRIDSSAFYGCSSLERVTLSASLTEITPFTFSGCVALEELTLPEGITSIGENAFDSCESLTRVFIPESVNVIGKLAFADCSSLSQIYFSGSDDSWQFLSESVDTGISSSVTVNCGSGELPIIPPPDDYAALGFEIEEQGSELILTEYTGAGGYVVIPDGVTKIAGWAFGEDSSITAVKIPGSVKDIGENAFHGCSMIENVYIEEGLSYIGDSAFFCCTSLTSLSLPEGVTVIGYSAFYGCTKLSVVDLPLSIESVGFEAFHDCPIQSASVPTSAVYQIPPAALATLTVIGGEQLGVNAFMGCIMLAEVEIYGVTHIEEGAFANCEMLSTIELPDTLTYVGVSAFENCTSLTDVYYTGSEDEWNTLKGNIGSGNDKLLNATIHYNYS